VNGEVNEILSLSTTAAPADTPFRWNADAVTDLLLRPERFFAHLLRTAGSTFPLLIIWINGMAGVVDRIDSQLVMGRILPEAPMLQGWVMFWGTVLIGGIMTGLLKWLVGGWWYRMRLGFSGAHDVDKRHARLVYFHAELVWAIPSLVWLALVTPLYPDYHAAWMEAPLGLWVIAIYPWSMWVSYRGVRHCFDVGAGRARLWFLILPLVMFLAAVAFIWAFAWFGTVG